MWYQFVTNVHLMHASTYHCEPLKETKRLHFAESISKKEKHKKSRIFRNAASHSQSHSHWPSWPLLMPIIQARDHRFPHLLLAPMHEAYSKNIGSDEINACTVHVKAQ